MKIIYFIFRQIFSTHWYFGKYKPVDFVVNQTEKFRTHHICCRIICQIFLLLLMIPILLLRILNLSKKIRRKIILSTLSVCRRKTIQWRIWTFLLSRGQIFLFLLGILILLLPTFQSEKLPVDTFWKKWEGELYWVHSLSVAEKSWRIWTFSLSSELYDLLFLLGILILLLFIFQSEKLFLSVSCRWPKQKNWPWS